MLKGQRGAQPSLRSSIHRTSSRKRTALLSAAITVASGPRCYPLSPRSRGMIVLEPQVIAGAPSFPPMLRRPASSFDDKSETRTIACPNAELDHCEWAARRIPLHLPRSFMRKRCIGNPCRNPTTLVTRASPLWRSS